MKKEKWPTVPLGELVDNLDSKRRPITKSDRHHGEYPYYGATGILDYVDAFLFDEPLVLVGEDGAKWGVGEKTAFLADGKYWVNNHAHVLRPLQDRLVPSYLIYFLNTIDLGRFVTGITVPKLTQAKLNTITIPLPPLPIQRQIVSILDAASELKKKREEADKKMAEFAPALFHQMFGDPGRNEKGWEVRKLGEVCRVLNGYAFKSENYTDSGIRVIRITNVQKGRIVDDSPKFYSLDSQEPIEKYELHEDDLLVSLTGNVGRVGLLTKELLPAALNQRVACVRIKDASLEIHFLFQLLNDAAFERDCIAASSGIAQKNLGTSWLNDYQIFIPPLNLQQQFASRIAEARKSQDQQDKSRKKLEEVFEGVMAELF